MSLTTLALALFFLLYAASSLGWFAVNNIVMGVVALICAVAILVDSYHPVTVWRRPPQA